MNNDELFIGQVVYFSPEVRLIEVMNNPDTANAEQGGTYSKLFFSTDSSHSHFFTISVMYSLSQTIDTL